MAAKNMKLRWVLSLTLITLIGVADARALTYYEFEQQDRQWQLAYAVGLTDMLLNYTTDEHKTAAPLHYRECVGRAKMTHGQLANLITQRVARVPSDGKESAMTVFLRAVND